MTKPISWNTDRPYSETGQLIFAKILADNRVIFHDTARGIIGRTTYPMSLLDETAETHVMHCYDHGFYKDISSAEWYELTKDD